MRNRRPREGTDKRDRHGEPAKSQLKRLGQVVGPFIEFVVHSFPFVLWFLPLPLKKKWRGKVTRNPEISFGGLGKAQRGTKMGGND